jgi:hypothetical protein
MFAQEWIKKAQGNGWRVAAVSGASIEMRCAKQGCPGRHVLPMGNLGPVLDQCALDHVGQYGRETFDGYEALIAELRRRRVQIGLDQGDLGNAMGVPDGYINKLESFKRTATPVTLLLWAQSLGLTLTTAPAPLPPATIRAIEQRTANPYNAKQARFKHDRQ